MAHSPAQARTHRVPNSHNPHIGRAQSPRKSHGTPPPCTGGFPACAVYFIYCNNMLAVWIQSLFSFRSYHRLAHAGGWKTGLFALYLLLVGVLVFNIWFAVQVHKHLPDFLRTFPAVTFEHGRLSAPDKAVSAAIPGTDFKLVFDAKAEEIPSRRQFLNERILAFVRADGVYLLSAAGVQKQTLPPQLNAALTPDWLRERAPAIARALQSMAFFGSFIVLGLFLVFSYGLAFFVVSLWNGLTRSALPARQTLRLAVFLQGPALALWLINLLGGVPLFPLGLFILFNIYTQQIFNTLPQETR